LRSVVARTGRLAIVPPRFGDEVIGGAEQALREAAEGLAERGWDVDVLTTCARDHFSWANEYPEGESYEGKLRVVRFPTVLDTSRSERSWIHAAILRGEPVPVELQERWMNDDLRVPSLWHHLLVHADDYRAIAFAPYLFWTTFACGQVAPDRTLLMPCLHDEPEARLDIYGPLFSGARAVWFLSEPERDLARELYELPERHEVLGTGVHVPDSYDPEGFRARHGIDGPFVLYSGRREGAKGWEWMLDAFATAVTRHGIGLKLVTTGTGDVKPPAAVADRVVDLGFVSAKERDDAMAAASAYLQPSALESFSRTAMETWLAGTLLVANGRSDVVRWHCERSGAGLTYEGAEELIAALRFVDAEPDAARALAAGGRQYVLDNYRWDAVLNRLETAIDTWFPA
jgi:glycosyltransferase involved in cell wall biosynthesis